MPVEIPHFDFPFRFNGTNTAVVNEQDSDADVTACVEMILVYRKGLRSMAPHFGIEDPTFDQAPFDASGLVSDLEGQEPRIRAELMAVEDELDQARNLAEGLDIVRIAVGVPTSG